MHVYVYISQSVMLSDRRNNSGNGNPIDQLMQQEEQLKERKQKNPPVCICPNLNIHESMKRRQRHVNQIKVCRKEKETRCESRRRVIEDTKLQNAYGKSEEGRKLTNSLI